MEKIVGRCDNFIFVLTDNVFDSPWCIKELEAAVKNDKNIILVTKDGSRWKDANGSKTCLFPPYEIINALPEEAQKAFVSKAVAHSDEYYQAFKDQLIRRIKRSNFPEGEWPEDTDAAVAGKRYASIAELSRKMNRTETYARDLCARLMREKIDVSEQVLTQKLSAQVHNLSDQVHAQSREMLDLVKAIEGRLNANLEAKMKEVKEEVKEEVRVTTRDIKDSIISLSASNMAYTRAPTVPPLTQATAGGFQPSRFKSLEEVVKEEVRATTRDLRDSIAMARASSSPLSPGGAQGRYFDSQNMISSHHHVASRIPASSKTRLPPSRPDSQGGNGTGAAKGLTMSPYN